ncbi:phosphonate transport system permease protein [Pilibacter termitis]|uniref:Phosphonate transport system permease protein n=1 Tax=Pilibacter termitis TaxID=263852 RepID=A0A1T4KDM7_9ENTE|nr:ABC transporter permease subunit [Pilibacter termitis]SJZ40534.1 phosphonate transport system permease protein [Pilibacter termitis]
MNAKIALSRKKEKIANFSIVLGLILLFLVSIYSLKLDVATFVQRFTGASEIVSKFMRVDFSELNAILFELFTSICMAISALFLGFVFSFILSFLGASNTSPFPLFSAIIKGAVGIVRAIPALVWILIVVASLGFGNTSGVVGLVIPTVGYLTKSFISSIEEQEQAIIETMRSTGASWLQMITEGLLPGLATSLLSWTSIRLESNIAESISLGMLGAGGIGMLLMRAIKKYDYATISTIILFIFVTMLIVELSVGKLKKTIR